jgi:hypothetical protein
MGGWVMGDREIGRWGDREMGDGEMGRWGVTDWLLNPGFWFLAPDTWPPNFEF